MAVRVQQDDFDVGAESRALQGPAVGAIALFVGTVRSLSEDDSVTAMTLEHYPGMTEAEISRIEDEARARWPLLGVTVVHRVGRLLAGEQIVLVAVSSAHRQAAFDAAQYLMDFLKTKKTRNVRTIILAAVSRRDLCYVSENEGFRFFGGKKT